MSSPTSTRSFISPLLSALGIMSSRSSQGETSYTLHEFKYSKMAVKDYYDHLKSVYVINEGLKRAEAYYVSELRILKEPPKKLKTCHEYVIAVIMRTDGKGEVNYLAFERSIGKQPQTEVADVHPPHPDRLLERQLFMDKKEVPESDNEDDHEASRVARPPLLARRAMASTASLDSLRKKAILADDRVLVLSRPYCQKDDVQVAVLRLQPPPNAVLPPEPPTGSSSTSNTPRFRLRKLSDSSRERNQTLHRTTSGPGAISYVPRDISHTESSTAPSIDSSPSVPDPPTTKSSSKPLKRKWIYLYELAIIAHKLSDSKSLYRLFSKNCYWFAGMLIHVVRVFTDNTLELREGNRVGHVQPNEDILSWYDKQMGKWMNVIRVVKTPMNYTLDVLVEEFWAERLEFEKRVIKQRLDHTQKVREKEKRKEEELRKAREDTEAERMKREAREEELRKVREEEGRRNEELQRVREEERRKNEEELQRVRNEQEKDRKAREEAEQKVKLLMEYLKAGSAPPPELLAQIGKMPQL